MLEWGSGGSTVYYSQFVKQYYSIEHNRDWYNAMRDAVKEKGNIRYALASVEDGHNGWRGGLAPGDYDQFKTYVHAPERLFKDKLFDRVLVDGRARVACAVSALRFLTAESLVFIHDYTIRAQNRRYSQ
eukprot:scaffold46726_cov52-Prasinocladus_malaysianus.AAC.1